MKAAELQAVDAVVLNAFMQVVATTANESSTLAEALEVTRAQLVAHDDWHRAVAFSVVSDGAAAPRLAAYPMSAGDPEPTDLERRTAERALAKRATVFEEDEDPQHPLIAFLLRRRTSRRWSFRHHEHEPLRTARDAPRDGGPGGRPAGPGRRARVRLTAAWRRSGRRDGGVAPQVRVPRDDEPRDPHPDERRDRAQRAAPAHRPDAPTSGASPRRPAPPDALLGLINDILDFSKIEAGELELEVRRLRGPPDRPGRRRSSTDRPGQGDRPVGRGRPRRSRALVGDPTRLGQVLSNLVSNAMKFTERRRPSGARAVRRPG